MGRRGKGEKVGKRERGEGESEEMRKGEKVGKREWGEKVRK